MDHYNPRSNKSLDVKSQEPSEKTVSSGEKKKRKHSSGDLTSNNLSDVGDVADYSLFQKQVLDTVRSKLNMMLTECCQLKKKEEVNFSDCEELSKTILEKIASGEIKSHHMSEDEAKRFISLIKGMGCKRTLSLNHFDDDNVVSEEPVKGGKLENSVDIASSSTPFKTQPISRVELDGLTEESPYAGSPFS